MGYLREIFGNVPDAYISVTRFPSKITKWFSVSETDAAEQYMLRAGQQENVYFNTGLFAEPVAQGRGSAANVIARTMFFLDIDIKSPNDGVHSKNESLFTSLDEFLQMTQSLGAPEPTFIRNSGNGYYADWVLEEPCLIHDENQRALITANSKRFQRVFIEAAKRAGKSLDDVGDLTRITRLPGTRNHKTDPSKPVELYGEMGSRIPYDQLIAWIEETEDHLDIGSSTALTVRPAKTLVKKSTASDGECDFEAVRLGCAWVASCCESRSIPEPDWYNLASIAERCEDGAEIFHQISANDPRYDEAETASKLGRHGGPVKCETVAGMLGFHGCVKCPFSRSLTSPIQLGRMSREFAALASKHAFVVGTHQFVDLESGEPLIDRAFTAKYRHMIINERTTPTNLLLNSSFTLKADNMDYQPGSGPFLDTPTGVNLNVWQKSGVSPTYGETPVIEQHLRYIMPDDAARKHFLDVLAFHAKHPAIKIRHLLLLIGNQGIGKSFLYKLVQEIFGSSNCLAIEGSAMGDRFNASVANKQVLILEEMRLFDRRDLYESFKLWIGDDKVRIEEKYLPVYFGQTPKVMLAFSNHATPIALPEDERRFWIYRSPAERESEAYYARLFSRTDGGLAEASSFLGSLLTRDIGNFSPDGRPPMTTAKAYVIEQSKPQLQREIETLMSEENYPFNRDLFHLEELRIALMQRVPISLLRNIGRVIEEMGHVQLKQVRVSERERPRLWAWRNQTRWLAASAEDMRTEYRLG